MTLLDHLISVSEAFAAARGLSRSRVSTIVFGDGRKLDLVIRDGADITTRRLEAAMSWFSANWPAGAAWPDGVPRPAVAVAVAADAHPAAAASEAAA